MLITLMPVWDSSGSMPFSLWKQLPWMLNAFGMEGPVMSASRMAVL